MPPRMTLSTPARVSFAWFWGKKKKNTTLTSRQTRASLFWNQKNEWPQARNTDSGFYSSRKKKVLNDSIFQIH